MAKTWLWLLTLVSIPFSLLFVGTTAIASVPGFLVGCALVVPYMLFYVWLFRRTKAWPATVPVKSWFWVSLLWGGATSMAIIAGVSGFWLPVAYNLGLEAFGASLAGGYSEEIAKALGVFLILCATPALNRPWHGFIVGAMVGLGFEVVENLSYGAMGALMHVDSDVEGAIQVWMLRTFIGPGLHVMFSALAGFGVGWALHGRGWGVVKRVRCAVVWLAVAIAGHFMWNIMWPTAELQILGMVAMAAIFYPMVAWMYIRCNKDAKEFEQRPQVIIQSVAQLEAYRKSLTHIHPAEA